MSFKIKRQSQKESYKITCDWINDFANSIEKNANYIDTLRKRNSVDNSINNKHIPINVNDNNGILTGENAMISSFSSNNYSSFVACPNIVLNTKVFLFFCLWPFLQPKSRKAMGGAKNNGVAKCR